MILWISGSGECCPIAYRMMREGADVQVYIHSHKYKKEYNGMLPKVSISEVRKVSQEATLCIFDSIRVNDKSREDVGLLQTFGLPIRTSGVFGAIAEKIRKHTKVIGASTWTQDLELDRMNGERIAKNAGFDLPTTQEFNRLSEAVKFLGSDEGGRSLWVFKPDNNMDLDLTYVEKFNGELADKLTHEYMTRLPEDKFPFILQKKIEGVEISTEGWFNGTQFTQFNHTIEDKRLMNGNLGPATGSQSNIVWTKEGSFIAEKLRKLGLLLRSSGYIGPVDVNCIITKDKQYFLEWTPRIGYDAIYCLLAWRKGKITEFFEKGFPAFTSSGFVGSQRVSIPPYPYASGTLLRELAYDVSVSRLFPDFWAEDVYFDGSLRCAGADGAIGVITGPGKNLGEAVRKVYDNINDLKVSSYLQYRTDLGRRCEKALKTLTKWGISYE